MDVDFWSFPEKRGPTPAKLRTREKVGGFFSPEAGQARRQWLNGIDDRIAEGLRYYLGPSGVDQKVTAAAQGGQMLMDGADFQDAYTAGGDLMQSRSIPEAAANFLEFAAPAAAVMIPGVSNRMLQGAGDMAEDAARFVVDESGALRLGGGSPAQQVADLLASGRASDVTDDMLAKLTPNDNAELFRLYQSGATGADMPMDVASRMARAGKIDAYHGGSTDLDAMDSSRLGQNFDNKASKAGFWSSSNPDDAEFYGPIVSPLRLSGRYADLPSMEGMGEETLARLKATSDRLARDWDANAGTERRVNDYIDYIESTHDPRLYTSSAASKISKAKRGGYDGARLVGGEAVQDVSDPGDNFVTFDPRNIRSRFARFDPRLSHLANLSAAGAGVAVINGQDDLTPEEQFRRMWWAQQPQKGNSQ